MFEKQHFAGKQIFVLVYIALVAIALSGLFTQFGSMIFITCTVLSLVLSLFYAYYKNSSN